jgi:hypothetical protein
MNYIECPAEWLGTGSDRGVFLAGGVTRCPDWQRDFAAKLSASSLTFINPRRKQWDVNNKSLEVEQIEWEHRHLLRAHAILFWFPSETLCPITLYELGSWNFRPKKLFIGCHPEYKRIRDVKIQTRLERPKQVVVTSLDDLAVQVLQWEANNADTRDLS